MKRYEMRRILIAIALLMVMMMQLGVKSFHQHHRVVTSEILCDDCLHHKVHGGHLLSWDGATGDCPVCQMMQTPYIAAQSEAVSVAETFSLTYGIAPVSKAFETEGCHIAPRGPPYIGSNQCF